MAHGEATGTATRPVRCPEGHARDVVAAYYYAARSRPATTTTPTAHWAWMTDRRVSIAA